MPSLDTRRVQEPGIVADQCATRERQLRQQHQTTRGDRPRTVFRLVTFASSVSSSGSLKAVVGADIKLDSVISIIANVHPTPASFAFLMYKSGTVIAYPNSNFALKPVIDISKEFTSSKLSELLSASTPIPIPIDGAVKLLRAKPVLGSDWMLVICLDQAEAKAGVHAFALSSLLSVVILSTTALIFVSIMLSGPFKPSGYRESWVL